MNESTNTATETYEQRRAREVEEVLERSRLTREQVERSMNGETAPAVAAAPAERHWTDELKDIPDGDTVDGEVIEDLPERDIAAAAEKINNELVPAFGSVLRDNGPTALTYGFPPAIQALVVKTKIDEDRARNILARFRDAYHLANEWSERAFAIVVADEEDTETIASAKNLHRIVRDERINIEKKKTAIKEPALRECQLIDGVTRHFKELLEPIETHLLTQAKFAENKEKERREQLKAERAEKLKLFEADPNGFDLANMSDEAFDVVYQGAVASYNARKDAEKREEEARLERERAAEAERIRLKADNDRLEKERAEAAAREAEQKRIADEERRLREEAEQKIRDQEAARKAEEARLAAIEEAKRLAPDKEKLDLYARAIQEFATAEYPKEIESEAAKQLADAFFDQLGVLVNDFAEKVARLQAATPKR